ncbi:MAG TPA: methyltransferase domain-containing protein [Pyrinomonadaceae bacterium]|nr:methyltransferase domain-containing protein [Pyrinomonadaceae bacterium]
MTFDANYTKQRSQPVRGESLYLHLSDALLALETAVKSIEVKPGGRILDFGAGTSPYDFLFDGCQYLKADITPDTSPELLIGADGKVSETDESFEIVLSTQVIEHVYDPQSYLAEVYRLLKPQGTFLLGLPCLYEDHKCPNDYQRWMRQGLERDLENAGFKNIKIYKVTVGARGLMFFWDRYIDSMHTSRKKIHGLMHFVLRNLYRYPVRKFTHFLSDQIHDDLRVLADKEEWHSFYINLLAVAEK